MNSKNLISAGPAADFPLETLRIVSISVPKTGGTREIGIVRRADGTVDAVRNWCPHKGAPICKGPLTGTMLPGAPGTLTWARDGEILRCPWHAFEFELKSGARLYSDSRMRLRVYPAKIIDGQIQVDLGPRRGTETAS
jgi:nitrite reductase (NADH) small subunit